MTKSLRDFKNASERREFLEDTLKIKLEGIGNFSFSEDEVEGRNIENLVGTAQIPLGIAGPVAISHNSSNVTHHYIPLATTEGALIASVSRGCKAITQSGGAKVVIEETGMSRAPIFRTDGINHSREIINFVTENYDRLADICEETSNHLKLRWVDFSFAGKNLYIRFLFETGDAMGMNMATIAAEKAVKFIERKTKSKCISLSGNFDVDKKASWLNFLFGRGKKVWAEVVVPKKIVKEVLKTTPEKISELVLRKVLTGSALSGTMGFNAHYANIIAAIFIATGQDSAHVVEGSLGLTSAEVLENGDLYFSICLPSLLIGTVGGGTNLPTQKESLNITSVKSVLEFAEVIAAAVLAGELSLLASQSEGTLAKAHINLGRKGKV